MSELNLKKEELMLEIDIALKSAELKAMLDGKDKSKLQTPSADAADSDEAPGFEFHGYSCPYYKKFKNIGKGHQKPKRKQADPLNDMLNFNLDNAKKYLADLGLDGTGIEHNLVIRIFSLIHSMHKYMNDELPTSQALYLPADYQYECPKPIYMPHTKSIPAQLACASRKLHKFIARMRRMLNTNMHFDYVKSKQCDDSLKILEQMHLDLEPYTKCELKHTNYELNTPQMAETAANLELLLQCINHQIRESHIYNVVFDRNLNLEHRQSFAMRAEHQHTLDYGLKMAELEKQGGETAEEKKERQEILDFRKKFGMEGIPEKELDYNTMLNQFMAEPHRSKPNYAMQVCARRHAQAEASGNENLSPEIMEQVKIVQEVQDGAESKMALLGTNLNMVRNTRHLRM